MSFHTHGFSHRYSSGQPKHACLLAPEGIFLAQNGLHIQTQHTQKHQKMIWAEFSHVFLSLAKFWGQKNNFIASVHPFCANFWPLVMSDIKLSYLLASSGGKIKFDMNNLQPIIFDCEFACHWQQYATTDLPYSAFQWNAESHWTIFVAPQSATVLPHRKAEINMASMGSQVRFQHTTFFKIIKKHVHIIKIY